MWYLNAPVAPCLIILISAGIDLAKNRFSLHALGQNGKVILHKSVTRSKLLTTIANMPFIGVDPIAHYKGKRVIQSDLCSTFSCRKA